MSSQVDKKFHDKATEICMLAGALKVYTNERDRLNDLVDGAEKLLEQARKELAELSPAKGFRAKSKRRK